MIVWLIRTILKVNENAQQDLKEGLQLYNTDNNIGLRNAWNIIQSEVGLCAALCVLDIYILLMYLSIVVLL